MLGERGRVFLEADLEHPKRPDPKMDLGELGGAGTNIDDCELPGTPTRGYSKSSGLSEILHTCAFTDEDATGVILSGCCNVGCVGAFGCDLASTSRSVFSASLSFMVVIEEYWDSQEA